jgi:hypothetical protein
MDLPKETAAVAEDWELWEWMNVVWSANKYKCK